jgi:hypothetical protein
MTRNAGRGRFLPILPILALVLVAGAGSPSIVHAQPVETLQQFWHIPVWALPGAWQDSTTLYPNKRVGRFHGPLPDSLRKQGLSVTVRFLRSRRVEARADFGGYRIYRVTNTPDTTRMMLVRRYSTSDDSLQLWPFSRVNPTDLQLLTDSGHELPVSLPKNYGLPAYDSVLTFVDPDSSGALVKVCRRVDNLGRCLSKGDSVWALVAPSGPHNGFRTWYSVTYEAQNTVDNNYEDLFVPDTSGDYARCAQYGVPGTCPNLNGKAANIIATPVEPTPGPTANLQNVGVVPNPFRATETWDRPNGHEVHFVNLPAKARIRIYTVAGDLVADLDHDESGRLVQNDFEVWDLKNAAGRDVSSGIYMYRIESGSFSAQNRFVVIR